MVSGARGEGDHGWIARVVVPGGVCAPCGCAGGGRGGADLGRDIAGCRGGDVEGCLSGFVHEAVSPGPRAAAGDSAARFVFDDGELDRDAGVPQSMRVLLFGDGWAVSAVSGAR